MTLHRSVDGFLAWKAIKGLRAKRPEAAQNLTDISLGDSEQPDISSATGVAPGRCALAAALIVEA